MIFFNCAFNTFNADSMKYLVFLWRAHISRKFTAIFIGNFYQHEWFFLSNDHINIGILFFRGYLPDPNPGSYHVSAEMHWLQTVSPSLLQSVVLYLWLHRWPNCPYVYKRFFDQSGLFLFSGTFLFRRYHHFGQAATELRHYFYNHECSSSTIETPVLSHSETVEAYCFLARWIRLSVSVHSFLRLL